MKKSQFKEIIKECIRELIDEGAFDIALEDVMEESLKGQMKTALRKQSREISELKQQVMNASAKRQQQTKNAPPSNLREVLENSFIEQEEENGKLNSHINQLVESQAMLAGGGNQEKTSMMKEIFADTARSMHMENYQSTTPTEQEVNELNSLAKDGDPMRWAKILNRSMGSKK